MKRTLLSIVALVVSAIAATAQPFAKAAPAASVQKAAAQFPSGNALKAPKKIELADNQLVMGPYTTDSYATSSQGIGLPGYPGTIRIATYLDVEDFASFNGGKVVKMRVALANSAAVSRVFITPVTANGIGNDIVSEQVSFSSTGWNEVELAQPADLDFTGCEALLMGFDYTQNSNSNSDTSYPLSFVLEGASTYSTLVYGNFGSGTQWYNLGTEDYGNLSVQAVVEGDFAENAALPKSIGNVLVPFGGSKEVEVAFINVGKAAMTSADYVLTIDGVDGEEQHVTFPAGVAFGTTGSVNVTFNSAETETTQNYTLTVTKVNGEKNSQADAFTLGLVASTSKQIVKRAVIEEFTGTGCMWCPRGYIGMELIRKHYGEDVVAIALHQYNSGDAMYIAPNSYASLGFSGAPQCAVDRITFTDPYYGTSNQNFGISQDLDKRNATAAEVGVSVNAMWSEDNTTVDATAALESAFNGGQYNVEFVLIGDSLKGTAAGWNQQNTYAAYTVEQVGSEDMAPFCKNGKYGQTQVKNLYYNDVALSSSYKNGKNQVEPVTVTSDATEVSFSLSLPTKATLKQAIDNDNLFVAALVVDPVSKVILNAAKAKVEPYDATVVGIFSTTAGEVRREAGRFAADGRQMAAPQKGLNIVRMADGTVRKVIVR